MINKKFLLFNTLWFLLASVVFYVLEYLNSPLYHPQAEVTNVFFYFLTLNIHFVGKYADNKFKDQFALLYMLVITFRLLASLSFFTVLWYKKVPNMMVYTFNFLLLYLSYTVFEISSLLATLRPNLKR